MSEHMEQTAVFKWVETKLADYPELELLFAVPNGLPMVGGRHARSMIPQIINYLKVEGLKKGVPDMFLPVARAGFHGLFIEQKIKGGKLSDEQKWWLDKLRDQGYFCVDSWSQFQTQGHLLNYLEGNVPYTDEALERINRGETPNDI